MPVEKIYRGLPPDAETATAAAVTTSAAAWLDWRFLLAFIVIFILFLVLLGLICHVRRRRQLTTPPAVEEEVSLRLMTGSDLNKTKFLKPRPK